MYDGQIDRAPLDAVAIDGPPASTHPAGPTAFASAGVALGVDPAKTTGTLR